MECPNCQSTAAFKNGHRKGKQCYQCKQCGRQFLDSQRLWSYSAKVRERCIGMYRSGLSFRSIERITQIHHTTVLRWVREDLHPSPHLSEPENL